MANYVGLKVEEGSAIQPADIGAVADGICGRVDENEPLTDGSYGQMFAFFDKGEKTVLNGQFSFPAIRERAV